MKFLSNIDLNHNELQNFVVQNIEGNPNKTKKGLLWFDNNEKKLKYFDGSEIKIINDGSFDSSELTELVNRAEEASNNVDAQAEVINNQIIIINQQANIIKDYADQVNADVLLVNNYKEDAKNAKDQAIDSAAAAEDALKQINGIISSPIKFKSTISSFNEIEDIKVGDMYIIGKDINYNDIIYEAGDTIIAKENAESFDITKWAILEKNQDDFGENNRGLVPNPEGATRDTYLTAQGWKKEYFTTSCGEYILPEGEEVGTFIWEINHKLNKSYPVQVLIYYQESESYPYELVMADVEIIDENNCRVIINTSKNINNDYIAIVR